MRYLHHPFYSQSIACTKKPHTCAMKKNSLIPHTKKLMSRFKFLALILLCFHPPTMINEILVVLPWCWTWDNHWYNTLMDLSYESSQVVNSPLMIESTIFILLMFLCKVIPIVGLFLIFQFGGIYIIVYTSKLLGLYISVYTCSIYVH